MEFHRVTEAGSELFEPAFNIYKSSFPLCECRTREGHIAALQHSNFHCEAIVVDNHVVGVVCWWLFTYCAEPYIFVEHLATAESVRGSGLGAKVLEYLKRKGCTIILEIEPPTEPLAKRREGFYHRAGFATNTHHHKQPPYHKGDAPLPLLIMSYPNPISAEWYAQFAVAQRLIVGS